MDDVPDKQIDPPNDDNELTEDEYYAQYLEG